MQQIAEWLKNLGMPEYAGRFAEERIEIDVLPELTDQDLERLRIPLGHRRRPTGVERKMGNDLAQFALFEPVVERALQVADQLLLAAERYQGGARDQAAVALGEAGALPYLPEQHPLAEIDEGRDDVADLVTR